MIEHDANDKTCPPRRSLRYDTPEELYLLLPEVQTLTKMRPRQDEGNLQYLYRLRSSTTPEEAVTFAAFAALPSVACGWAYECLRLMADLLSPYEKPMMQDIAAWVVSPTTAMRHRLMREALFAPTRSPSVLLGLAVGWSTGGPAPNDPMRQPAFRTPQVINSAVLSGLARSDLSRRPVLLARFIDLAENLFGSY
ncbi:DUF6931 family protein [Paracoccus aminophilus]|uniref:Uncharacterized protein n=1 Tax=Paracoccus aminophilus JCM 7686 TaxID=1367847 RepID=S5YJ52_PARAH|nr:hypothetical protein [Paracoccus aminophilus]AGT11493.1 hypothetical protein JCM7686_pAMI6p163 [Paracoccus aminophilus JCM 7686]